MEYDFVLKFKLAEDSGDVNDLVERLRETGCDDAVVGIGQPGRIGLNFTREVNVVKESRRVQTPVESRIRALVA